jgi:TetR/AcrR family transcriptional repressor of nem operon
MRYDAEHKQKTRERVLQEAAKAVRAEGPHQIGVAKVMADAGLTHGGFYAHFKSREDLLAEAVGQMFREGQARLKQETEGKPPAEALNSYIDFYLSAAHRDTRTSGCPLPFLAADAPRLAEPSRERFARGAAVLADRLAGFLRDLGREEPEALAASALAELVGAVTLARAEPDPDRSDAMLARSRSLLKRRLGLEEGAR